MFYKTELEHIMLLIEIEIVNNERKNYSNVEASIYIMVASYRNYLYYKNTGRTSLELIHLPFVEKIINKNRLLRMENGVVHFKFEDNAKEKHNGNKI